LQLTTVSFEEDGTQITVERISTEILTSTEERPTST
jgi:hypothetical protein